MEEAEERLPLCRRFTPLSDARTGSSSSGSSSPTERHCLLRESHYGSMPLGDDIAIMGGQDHQCQDGHRVDEPTGARPLTFWPLLALIFYTASGGPFGIEGLVADVGPLLALIGYIVFPLIWSVPEALLTAELASTFPENAGSVAWVSTAFGEFPGYMRGSLSWLSGVVDNAIYPVLFADYLAAADARFAEPLVRLAIIYSFIAAFTYLCVRGVDVAGRVAIGVCAFALLPFAVLCLVGLTQVDLTRCRGWTHDLDQIRPSSWMLYLNTLFWNLNAFDGTASLAGQVQNPGRTYPRAMLVCIALVVISYVLPIFVGATATDVPYSSWHDGTFTKVARELGGPFLSVWVVVAAALSNVGLFLAEMNSDAYLLMGMAECGLLPSFLAVQSRYHTPLRAIVLSACLIAVLSVTCTFDELITMINWLYAIAEVFEILAFIKLRYDYPDLPRPYLVPLSNHAVTLLMVLPLTFVGVIVFTATAKTWLVSGSLAIFAVVSHYAFKRLRAREYLHFHPVVPSRYVRRAQLISEEEEEPGAEEEGCILVDHMETNIEVGHP